MKKYFVLSALALNCYSYTLYTMEIPGVNTKTQGHYSMFIRSIGLELKTKFNRVFQPQRRAYKSFVSNMNSCFFPMAIFNYSEVSSDIILSKAVGDIDLFYITKKESSFKNLDYKKNRFVSKRLFKGLVRDNGKFHYVQNGIQMYEMLDKGRVDFVIDSVPDAFLDFKNGESEFHKKYHYSKKKHVRLREYFACHNNVFGREVIKAINNRI